MCIRDRESVFQPFFRVDKSRSRAHGGVGLGLSLVWEIAALHGGQVQIERSGADGTVMLVTLPPLMTKQTLSVLRSGSCPRSAAPVSYTNLHATNIAEWVIFSVTGVHKEG